MDRPRKLLAALRLVRGGRRGQDAFTRDHSRDAAYEIDQRQRIVRLHVGAPSDVAVGPHEDQLFRIERRRFGVVDMKNIERHAAPLGRRDQAIDSDVPIESDQAVAVTQRVM